jgi:hypothetical protein
MSYGVRLGGLLVANTMASATLGDDFRRRLAGHSSRQFVLDGHEAAL